MPWSAIGERHTFVPPGMGSSSEMGKPTGGSRNAAQFRWFFSCHPTSPDVADGWSKPGQIDIPNESVSKLHLEKTETLRRILRSQPLRPRGIFPRSRLKW